MGSRGRPTKYNPDIPLKICKSVVNGNLTYSNICRDLGLTRATFYRWLNNHPELEYYIEIGTSIYWVYCCRKLKKFMQEHPDVRIEISEKVLIFLRQHEEYKSLKVIKSHINRGSL